MYQIMTFAVNGNPMPIINTKFETKEDAEVRLQELKKVFNVPLSVRKVK